MSLGTRPASVEPSVLGRIGRASMTRSRIAPVRNETKRPAGKRAVRAGMTGVRLPDQGNVTPAGHAVPPYPGFWHSPGLAVIWAWGIGHRFLYVCPEVAPSFSELGSCRCSWVAQ